MFDTTQRPQGRAPSHFFAARLGWLKDLRDLVAMGRQEAEELQHSAARHKILERSQHRICSEKKRDFQM